MATANGPVQSIPVYRAAHLRVVIGANLGDGAGLLEDLTLDDVYELTPGAAPARLSLQAHSTGALAIAPDSGIGTPGAALHLDCAMSLMSPDGQTTEALVLVEVDPDGMIVELMVLPLAPLQPQTEYTLVRFDRESAQRSFAQVACVSFTRGTHITMATGAQVPIENLKIGDRILTRDDGVQSVRWIGSSTLRATGNFAPILIRAGALNNANDLLVSPDHRLFVYQRNDEIGAGQPELLVKARHLVNGETVVVQDGGFVDYFQILFDRHHIIYAEGIAAESMLIDPRTKPALPKDLLKKIAPLLPNHGRREMHGLDVQKALLDRPDAIDLLRRASTR